MARHPQRLGLGVEQGVLDRSQTLADDPSRRRPRQAIKLGVNPLMVEDVLAEDPRRHALDNRPDPGRAKALVELAPSDDAAVGGKFQKVIIAPSRVAAQDFKTGDLHSTSPSRGEWASITKLGTSARAAHKRALYRSRRAAIS